MSGDLQAIVVGASVAGCTAATLLGRQGVRVALLERSSDPRAYKKACTHYIQPCALKTLERLGIVDAIERAGGLRNGSDSCSFAGWIRDPREDYGYNLRREKLDPLLREMAAGTPGVELHLGHVVDELVMQEGRVAGVVARTQDGARVTLRAPLVVAADGRHSKLGDMAGIPATKIPNNRFLHFAYYRLPRAKDALSKIWLRDPDVCYTFPNDDGLTCVATMPVKDKLPAFRADLEGSFLRMFDGLPEGPDLRSAERVSDILGMIEMPNTERRAAGHGIAFVGDAALASDPVLGVGCGWAFQSGEWLADDVGRALSSGSGLDEALETYAHHHRERLHPHQRLVNAFSRAKPHSGLERALIRAAASDTAFRRLFLRFNARLLHPRDVLTPGTLARAVWLAWTRKPSEPATMPPSPALS
jgi:flavin-dependent dehydrogenase